jgi:DNA-directed RNA polymerase specialized sigma24 family protein
MPAYTRVGNDQPTPSSLDHDLITAMRLGHESAFAEFDTRFHPLLESYARRNNIPSSCWDVCVAEVLNDEAMRFARSKSEPPINLSAYLIHAVRNRYLRMKRAANCRDRNHAAASREIAGELIIEALCSEEALRSSAGPYTAPPGVAEPVGRLANQLRHGLTDDEQSILDWIGQGIPQPQMAQWLGKSKDAMEKQIQRLRRRLRSDALDFIAGYELNEQRHVNRVLSRAG